MSVKASISLTETQNAFARGLVEKGWYPSLSAVMQRGLELLEHETTEREALRMLLEKRMQEPSISMDDLHEKIQEMLARKRAELGLDG